MDGFNACVHIREGMFEPSTSVEHKSMSSARVSGTVTLLCPICSGMMVAALERVEMDGMLGAATVVREMYGKKTD